jgi:nitrite reductase/ring-hydroxylating ferredoxin subunit
MKGVKMEHIVQDAPKVLAARLSDFKGGSCLPVNIEGRTLALFKSGDQVYAVDNRCPHMGFPLHRGSLKDGILTCHWHHARFDLASGGTFDQWADDVPTYPAEIRGDEIYIDLNPRVDQVEHQRRRLGDGLERNISLVTAKAVIYLLDQDAPPVEPFRKGLEFGVRNRRAGWGQGLTMHTCFMNMLPHLHPSDRARALFHGLSAVANDSDGAAPRFMLRPLPGSPVDFPTLKRWFRRFIEVRDAEGAERCIVSALETGADSRQMAEMLFSAVTDHRYIASGHPLDFTNKALEALDLAGWDYAGATLTSLAEGYASAARMEESNAWRNPIDLVVLLENAFELLPGVLEKGRRAAGKWEGRSALVGMLLEDDPQACVEALLEALRLGCSSVELAGSVAYAAARRIAHFHTSNEFGDWDTALHTFTFANAVHQGLRRTESTELVRGIFDAAMSIYLDRFLNIPAVRLPEPNGKKGNPEEILNELPVLLNRQQQVNEAGDLVARYLYAGGVSERLLAALGRLLLREDRNFHTIQTLEAAFRQYELLRGQPEAVHVLVAAGRYLAAHAPTMRAQGQTFQNAARLARGERLFDED